ncbi:MAG: hypothetical protein L0154_13880 [Chloroflexi bacterium]|nr:hypothetical protein [Chloroflexota bacterium]
MGRYVLEHGSDGPQEIGTGVMEDYVYLSPDQTYLYYSVVDTSANQTRIFQHVLATGQNQQIAQLPLPFGPRSIWRMGGWSPNGDWVVIVSSQFSQEPLLVRLDSETQQIAYARTPKRGWWTEDNRFLFVTQDTGTPDDIFSGEYLATIETIEVVDVETGETRDITADVPLEERYTELEFLNVLAASGYPIAHAAQITAPRPHIVAPADRRNATTASGEYCWQYHIASEDGILYERADIFNMGELRILDDGSLIFIVTAFPECSFLDAPVGEIVMLSPDGQATIITDQLTSIEDRNNAFTFELRSRFDIAPDQQHIVFIATDDEGGNSLYVAMLPDGEAAQLMVDGVPIENVEAVIWGH